MPLVPEHTLRQEEHETLCADCDGPIFEDASPGVWLHANPAGGEYDDGTDGYDLDRDHSARPELDEDESED